MAPDRGDQISSASSVQVADAIIATAGQPVSYRDVETDGANRAANNSCVSGPCLGAAPDSIHPSWAVET